MSKKVKELLQVMQSLSSKEKELIVLAILESMNVSELVRLKEESKKAALTRHLQSLDKEGLSRFKNRRNVARTYLT